jgi:chemotaxis signal transduction protein
LAELDNDVTTEVEEALPEEELNVCLFSIGGDTYALPVELFTEIIVAPKIFPVPTTPPHVLGVINLRGNIVPVVDIRPVLSLSSRSVPDQIAIVKHGTIALGIVVDNVSEVVGVPESRILAIPSDPKSPQQDEENRSRFFLGIVHRETGTAALLNIERILNEIKLK